jgi:hypothetical protein
MKPEVGCKYNKLTVVSVVEDVPNYYLCKCDCGNFKHVSKNSLVYNQVTSCGCNRTKLLIKEGDKFGRWVVVKRMPAMQFKNSSLATFLCLCTCGNTATVLKNSLIRGVSKSCGCLHKEIASENCTKLFLKHGHSQTKTHNSWRAMVTRCKSDSLYLDRGITVCERWLNSFENFLEDMGERPEGMTLDRVNNCLGYIKSNCRWASTSVQNFNKRSNLPNTSGRIGVSWNRNKRKWTASINVESLKLPLGEYRNKEDAIKVREDAEMKYYGVLKDNTYLSISDGERLYE